MNAKTQLHPFLSVWVMFLELLFRPFRQNRPETELMPIMENDNRELIKLTECEPVAEIPEIWAPKGIALRKSVMFLARSGKYRSAKVVGWEADGSLILSRKNGPPFRRRL